MRIIIIILFILLLFLIFILPFLTRKCKPHCLGLICGAGSDDGCGGKCNCGQNGICKSNGLCCYPNCNGLYCGDDGCGGICNCNRIPNGICNNNQCCYKQDCNNVYCGDDGCGGKCNCSTGATCSNQGICANNGVSGWTYNILSSNGTVRTNTNSALECAGWLPENVALNLLNFPCNTDKDCPYLDKCVDGFCNRNDVYQYWIYDPLDPSGYNCTKLRQGSNVCGIQKNSASAFDIIGNVGPNSSQCGTSCTIGAVCPSSGENSCCPQDWLQKSSNSSYCVDNNQNLKCCLNNPNTNDYSTCIATKTPSCETLNTWWKANLAQITNGSCGVVSTGPTLGINSQTLQNNNNFIIPCNNKFAGDICNYNDNSTTYSGICKSCNDGNLRCFPESMCVANYIASNQPGTCSSENVCN